MQLCDSCDFLFSCFALFLVYSLDAIILYAQSRENEETLREHGN